jgi:hypothetical protein
MRRFASSLGGFAFVQSGFFPTPAGEDLTVGIPGRKMPLIAAEAYFVQL